ncbi:unnamed protein product [Cylindrotheca closterium]|uniref:VWFD domain-containing protein n=1 Tax=Cylindrotheca closterium TaxID=2856 RepID=A0AAD2G1I4_9STRA|nr:unnamed protein product [Cylindrotheca closterium]
MVKLLSLTLVTIFLAAVTASSETETETENENHDVDWLPHITSWSDKRIEINGQCDLVMLQNAAFAEGLGMNIHIRTKIVGAWSYIKSVAINIGDDVLEIEGSPNPKDEDAHYWFNGEYQSEELETIGGFPVEWEKPTPYKQQYNIDLDSKYPGKVITIDVINEFIRFNLNGDAFVFGNSVGLLGDYKTGKTLARDGATELQGFEDLVDEWQVIPSEPKLFHQLAHPQFPDKCIRRESSSGASKSHFSKPAVDVEQAEAICSGALDDATVINDCISYILLGRDLDVIADFLVLKDYHHELLL